MLGGNNEIEDTRIRAGYCRSRRRFDDRLGHDRSSQRQKENGGSAAAAAATVLERCDRAGLRIAEGPQFTYANPCAAWKDGATIVSQKACSVKKAHKAKKAKKAKMKPAKKAEQKKM